MIVEYWNNLNLRERWIAGTGIVLVVVYLFYLLIYAPLSSAVDEKSKSLVEKKETLTWMQQVSQKHKPAKAPQTVSSSKLPTLIATQLRGTDFQKFPFQLEQTGQGDIQLSFETVPYNLLLNWLWKLSSEYTVNLKQVTVDRTGTEGLVKVTLILHSTEG